MTQLVVPIKNVAGAWEVPDVQEFVAGTGWRDGKFVVVDEIKNVVVYTSLEIALGEAELLNALIYNARLLEGVA